ncbi:hypothetical protein [Spirobacillus cienkowskii]|uniref:hypothetical protein n=1 Tax=Spirobacillus cienkowskii TaxID=495820 RepID=UPI0030CE2EDC
MKLIIFIVLFFGFLKAFSSQCVLYEHVNGHNPIVLKTGEFEFLGFRFELNHGDEISDLTAITILRKIYFRGVKSWKKTSRSLDKNVSMVSLNPGCYIMLYEGYNYNKNEYKITNYSSIILFQNLYDFGIDNLISSVKCYCSS